MSAAELVLPVTRALRAAATALPPFWSTKVSTSKLERNRQLEQMRTSTRDLTLPSEIVAAVVCKASMQHSVLRAVQSNCAKLSNSRSAHVLLRVTAVANAVQQPPTGWCNMHPSFVVDTLIVVKD